MRTREPTQRPHACDRRRAPHRATHRALPACPPSYADYILADTTRHEPESLEIMLRLLLVALPLVVALPAAFDEQEANAIQFEVQSPLQFEVRSPPDSRPLLPAAPQEINTTAPPHTPLRTHNTHAHTSPFTRRGTRARARRSTPRSSSSPTSSSQPFARRCAPARPAATHAARAAFGWPCRCARARKTGVHAVGAQACACRPLPRLPQLTSPRRGAPASARHNLRSPSARASAPPCLFC